jgi:hypothetical protein
MSSDLFEKNVGEMIRRAGLRPDEARARERFLREIEAPEERRSWKVAAAAAAILVAVTIVWSARSERPVDRTTGQSSTPKPPTPEPWSGHSCPSTGTDELLAGMFTLRGRLRPPQVIFDARSENFPDGLCLHVRVRRLSEKVEAGRLVSCDRETESGVVTFQKGVASYPWEYKGPVLVRVEASAPDELQERDVVRAMKVPGARRSWTFGASIWNLDVLWRLDPQYPEALDLARELRAFVGRVEEACASEALFKSREKALIAEAEKIQSRAAAFGRKSLFPASMGVVEFAARDLAVSMPIFTWEGGKLAGPKSYHTGNKVAATFRGDPFGFDAYRRYLDEAFVVAGREFLLWILRDATVSSLGEEHRKLLRDHALKPGVEDLAQRMLRLDHVGNDPALEADIRLLKK